MADIQSFAVAGGLVATLQAATGFRAPTEAGSDVPVYDGPPTPKGQLLQFVSVGWAGDSESAAGTFTGDHVGFGIGSNREETGSIDCVLLVGSGDSSFVTIRATAASILGDVSDAIRATPALGLGTVVQWAHITNGSWSQGLAAKGAFVKVTFTVEYLARI